MYVYQLSTVQQVTLCLLDHMIHSICFSGIVIPLMLSVGVPSPSSDCLAAVDDCLSNLCKSQQAIYSAVCGGEDNVRALYLVQGTGDMV